MKFNKKIFTLGGLLVATIAFAATQGDRLKSPVKVGDGTATNKSMIFDIGSGSANPVIRSTNTGTLQFSNNGVDFSSFGSGGGGLGINHITPNPDFELNANGYSAYQDAAGVTPVDATGGTPTVSIARTTVTGEIIRGAGTGKIIKDAVNRQGEGVSTPFLIDNADKGQNQSIKFTFNTGAGYVNCDILVYIVEVTGPNIITPAKSCLPQGSGQFVTTFIAKSTSSYRLAFHVATVSTAAYNVFIDDVQVGPDQAIVGPTITNSRPYAATVANITTDFIGANYWLIGNTLYVHFGFEKATGAGTSSSLIGISIPPGFTVDSSFNAIGDQSGAATWSRYQNGLVTPLKPGYNPSTGLIEFKKGGGCCGTQDLIGTDFVNTSIPVNTYDYVTGTVALPVLESSANVFIENTTVEYAFNTDDSDADDIVSFGRGSTGHQFNYNFTATHFKNVRFLNPILPTDKVELQIRDPSWENWHTVADIAGESGLVPYAFQGSTTYGIGIDTNNTSVNTDISVIFGRYPALGSTYGGAGVSWSGFSGYYWRVLKSSNPLGLGHNLVSQFSSGLVQNAGQLLGTNTNDAALPGMVGEFFECYAPGSGVGVNATYVNACTITFPPGTWDIGGGVFGAGMGVVTSFGCAISNISGNSDDGSLKAINLTSFASPTYGSLAGIMCPTRRMNFSTSTPIYLEFYSGFSGSPPGIRAESYMRGTRVR